MRELGQHLTVTAQSLQVAQRKIISSEDVSWQYKGLFLCALAGVHTRICVNEHPTTPCLSYCNPIDIDGSPLMC